MNEFPIEDLHRMLDDIEQVRRELSAHTSSAKVHVADYPELCMVILEILGWTNSAYMDTTLNINSSLLNKFVKIRGTIPVHVARAVADRVRSFLRSQDQSDLPETIRALEVKPQVPPRLQKTEMVTSTKQATNEIVVVATAERWIVRTSEMQKKIGLITSLLSSIIDQTRSSNLPESEQVMTDVERQQLIALLETTLNVLKSPLVEEGLLKKTGKSLKKAAASAAEKKVQIGLGKLMGLCGDKIWEFIQAHLPYLLK